MKYSLLLLVLLTVKSHGQNPGPRLTALGSGGTAMTSIWSLQQNPAGIAGLGRTIVSVAYERHFLEDDITTQTALFVLPTKAGVFGTSFESYGFDTYKEIHGGLFYARGFGDSFRLAIGAKYHQLNIPLYGSALAYSVEAGFQAKISHDFSIGGHISNPSQSQYKSGVNSALPVRFSAGATGKFSETVLMVVDVQKMLNAPVDVKTGIEFYPAKWFSLRGGMSAVPFKLYTGFGFKHSKIQIDASVSSHQTLGYSPQIALAYEF